MANWPEEASRELSGVESSLCTPSLHSDPQLAGVCKPHVSDLR